MDDPNNHLHVVEAVPLHMLNQDQPWRIQGVFSHEADAHAFLEQLDTSAFIPGSAAVQRMGMEAIKDALFEERLSSLAPLVKKLLG